MNKKLSVRLLVNFLISTFIPFTLVTLIIVNIFINQYLNDIEKVVNTSSNVISGNIATYLNELEQLTLIPYYNDEYFSYLYNKSVHADADTVRMTLTMKNLDSYMTFIRHTREDTKAIMVMSSTECVYFTIAAPSRTNVIEKYNYADEKWFQEALSANGQAILVGPHVPEYIVPGDPVISIVRSIVRIRDRKPVCVIKIDIDNNMFDKMLSDLEFQVTSAIVITDENQQILYASKEDLQTYDDDRWQVYSYPIGGYEWDVHILLSASELHDRTRIIYLSAIIFYIIGLIVALLSYRRLSTRLVVSVNKMKDLFHGMTQGDFKLRYDYKSNTELDSLGDSLNKMSYELNERIQKEYILALHQKDISFKALQAQIQPHFLFNTLNSFISLNQLGAVKKLDESIHALSEMMRYILRSPSVVSLHSEIKFISDYCMLQKLRYGDRFNYSIQYDVDLHNFFIPTLTLQPLIENSVIHAVEPSDHPCSVILSISMQNDFLVINISDDGPGFDMHLLENSERIGIRNVKERLSIYAGNSSFRMSSILGKGTTTIIEFSLDGRQNEDSSL